MIARISRMGWGAALLGAMVVFASVEVRAAVLAHWSFDETAGTVVADSGPENKDGTLANTGGDLNAAGVFGSGLSLSNGADYVAIPRLDISPTSFTVAAWINPTAIQTGDEIFGDWSNPWQFRFFLNNNGSIAATGRKSGPLSNNGNLFGLTSGAGMIATNQFQHVALTWSRDDLRAKLYIDGQPVQSQAVGMPAQGLDLIDGNHGQYQIGWKRDSGTAPGVFYEGLMDELWVFDEAMDGTQLQALMSTNAYTARVVPTTIDLADVVSGGSGLGDAPSLSGIEATNGAVGQGENRGQRFPASPGLYSPVSYGMVDGVFVPNGTVAGGQTVDSDGNTYLFSSATGTAGSYATWWPDLGGNVDPSGQNGNPNYGSPDHSIIEAHAQKGITFDLDAIRAEHPAVDFNAFRGTVGLSSGSGSIQYTVLLDGQLQLDGSFAGATGNRNFVIPVVGASKLTLAISDNGDGIGSDHGYFGDPRLVAMDLSRIDLADVVGGGNGFGDGTVSGINVANGDVGRGPDNGNHTPATSGGYYSVDEYAFVDGVFVPNGTVAGGQAIDSDGNTYSFAGSAGAEPSYASLYNGLNIVDPSGQNGNPDFTSEGHSIMSAHAQKGVTFDLAAIRAANPGTPINSFQTIVGQSRDWSTDYFVFVDGQMVSHAEFRGTPQRKVLNIPIAADAQKLTLVTTNGNVGGNSADHSYFGDPVLTWSETFTIDLADVVGGGDGFGNGTAIGINAANGDVGTGGAGDQYPNVPGAYYPVQEYGFVDGVFVPDGTIAGGQAIDATGTFEFDFAGVSNSESSYGPFFNGVNTISNPSNLGAAPDYGNPDNSIISAHAQKGITFDLQAIRDETGMIPTLFSSLVGESRGQAGGGVAWFVLVDGVDMASGLLTDNETFVEVELLPTDLFLTLVMANANNGNGSDHGYFGDPLLTLAVPEPSSIVLLVLGAIALVGCVRRRRR